MAVSQSDRIRALVEEAYPLVEEIAEGRAVLFVGAGLSMGAGLPSWGALLSQLNARLGAGLGEPQGDLLDYAQKLDHIAGRARLGEALKALLAADSGPTRVQRALTDLPWHTIFTTNFDHLLEDALQAQGRRFDPLRHDEEVGVLDPLVALPVVKFHGDIDDPANVVLTRRDYEAYAQRHPAFRPLFEALLATHTFFFAGFGLTDPNFLALDGTVRRALGRYRRRAWALVVDQGSTRIEEMSPYRAIRVTIRDADAFLVALCKEVQLIRDQRKHFTSALMKALTPARKELKAALRSLPEPMRQLPSEHPPIQIRQPTAWRHLRAEIYGLAHRAEVLSASDPEVWLTLGSAFFHMRQHRSALRALSRLPEDHRQGAILAARCHWYRRDYWRVRRTLEPVAIRPAIAPHGQMEIDVAALDEYPALISMFAAASNWVAEEHLDRKRAELASRDAGLGLRAMEAWLQDSTAPKRPVGFLWQYLHLHRGRAHVLLWRAGGEAQIHLQAADEALRAASRRAPKWLEPRLDRLTVLFALGLPRRAEELAAEVAALGPDGAKAAELRLEALKSGERPWCRLLP